MILLLREETPFGRVIFHVNVCFQSVQVDLSKFKLRQSGNSRMDETKSLQLGAVLIQPLSNSITGLSERCCTQIPKSLVRKIKRKVAAVFTTAFI